MTKVKTHTIIARVVSESDWDKIAWLASDETQEDVHINIDAGWVKNRRVPVSERFDAVIEQCGEVVGYVALERRHKNEGFRAFVVMDWINCDESIAEAAYEKLERMISENEISKVWMREMAGDVSLVSFMERHGFRVDKRYDYEGYELVNLYKIYEA